MLKLHNMHYLKLLLYFNRELLTITAGRGGVMKCSVIVSIFMTPPPLSTYNCLHPPQTRENVFASPYCKVVPYY